MDRGERTGERAGGWEGGREGGPSVWCSGLANSDITGANHTLLSLLRTNTATLLEHSRPPCGANPASRCTSAPLMTADSAWLACSRAKSPTPLARSTTFGLHSESKSLPCTHRGIEGQSAQSGRHSHSAHRGSASRGSACCCSGPLPPPPLAPICSSSLPRSALPLFRCAGGPAP